MQVIYFLENTHSTGFDKGMLVWVTGIGWAIGHYPWFTEQECHDGDVHASILGELVHLFVVFRAYLSIGLQGPVGRKTFHTRDRSMYVC